jgi:hypothetical protein
MYPVCVGSSSPSYVLYTMQPVIALKGHAL